jgi:hypothetical protein
MYHRYQEIALVIALLLGVGAAQVSPDEESAILAMIGFGLSLCD